MVPLRGSPYRASFSSKTTNASVNSITGPAMNKYLQTGLEEIHTYISETTKGASTKDKNLTNDVKALIAVKDCIDSVTLMNDDIVLKLDCLDESIKCF